MSKFKIILVAVFIFAILAAVVFFSFLQQNKSGQNPPVVIWGTVPSATFEKFISEFDTKNVLDITYVDKSEVSFNTELVEALADGEGPDLLFVPHTVALSNIRRLIDVPYESYSERDFNDNFANGADIYKFSQGVIGVPAAIDPLVLYWNRDTFSTFGIAEVPKKWTDLEALVNVFTKKNERGNLSSVAIGLGEYKNVEHSKAILSTIFFQNQNPIVSVGDTGGLVSNLNTGSGRDSLSFYTKFSNPTDARHYTWNRSFKSAKSAFIAGASAMYIGYASEIGEIRKKNPNLNFDVASLPRSSAPVDKVFGKFLGFSILRNASNIGSAYTYLVELTSEKAQNILSRELAVAPARRRLLANAPSRALDALIYRSAIQSAAWLDLESKETDLIFERMVENVTSGRQSVASSLSTAHFELSKVISQELQ